MKKILLSLSVFSITLLPSLAMAQQFDPGKDQTLGSFMLWIISAGNFLIPVLITIGVVYLVFNIVMYVIAGDEEKKKAARTNMVWGIVGLFVIMTIWGLVNILSRTFNISSGGTHLVIPCAFYDDMNPGKCRG